MKVNSSRIARTGVLLLAAALLPSLALAQQGAERQPPSEEQIAQQVEKRVQEMRERLELTEEQEQQMQPILADNMKQLRELRQSYQGKGRDRETMQALRGEAQAMQQATRAKLEGILTPEQMTEYDAIQEEWRKERRSKAKGSRRGR